MIMKTMKSARLADKAKNRSQPWTKSRQANEIISDRLFDWRVRIKVEATWPASNALNSKRDKGDLARLSHVQYQEKNKACRIHRLIGLVLGPLQSVVRLTKDYIGEVHVSHVVIDSYESDVDTASYSDVHLNLAGEVGVCSINRFMTYFQARYLLCLSRDWTLSCRCFRLCYLKTETDHVYLYMIYLSPSVQWMTWLGKLESLYYLYLPFSIAVRAAMVSNLWLSDQGASHCVVMR